MSAEKKKPDPAPTEADVLELALWIHEAHRKVIGTVGDPAQGWDWRTEDYRRRLCAVARAMLADPPQVLVEAVRRLEAKGD